MQSGCESGAATDRYAAQIYCEAKASSRSCTYGEMQLDNNN